MLKINCATFDRKGRSDPNEGEFPSEPFNGCIDFRKIHFHYPTRANVQVLNRFSHKVEAGQSVALVGQSGCGKSTLLQLVQRFYDVSNHGAGSGIFMSGHDLRKLAPNWIRQQIGIVSQEPNLFDMSIRDNIAYGDNSRELSMEEIIKAAKEANAHTFIEALPDFVSYCAKSDATFAIFKTMDQKQFHVFILHCFLMGKNTVQAKQWLEKCYEDSVPSDTTIKHWFADFKRGRRDTDDAEHDGRPNETVTPENIKKNHKIVLNDQKVKLHELTDIVEI
ncbi:unnamed protein product [Hymenolepis diminuta]|uniref:ABC transporter domain-containing protein n=1 Tax=Hymenolepis diminuta TaxID=6216 RepID=A0A564Z738_HYMDI|nr:unnamed protein product [Hymenolepis diminuta]